MLKTGNGIYYISTSTYIYLRLSMYLFIYPHIYPSLYLSIVQQNYSYINQYVVLIYIYIRKILRNNCRGVLASIFTNLDSLFKLNPSRHSTAVVASIHNESHFPLIIHISRNSFAKMTIVMAPTFTHLVSSVAYL